jgi:hypothetical protein
VSSVSRLLLLIIIIACSQIISARASFMAQGILMAIAILPAAALMIHFLIRAVLGIAAQSAIR